MEITFCQLVLIYQKTNKLLSKNLAKRNRITKESKTGDYSEIGWSGNEEKLLIFWGPITPTLSPTYRQAGAKGEGNRGSGVLQ